MLTYINDLSIKSPRAKSQKLNSENILSSGAKTMPSRNLSDIHTAPVSALNNSGIINQNNFYGSRANKRQAPSTVSAEAYLASRSSLRPVYIHNEMITRMQNVSNLSKHPPRFKDQVDLIA